MFFYMYLTYFLNLTSPSNCLLFVNWGDFSYDRIYVATMFVSMSMTTFMSSNQIWESNIYTVLQISSTSETSACKAAEDFLRENLFFHFSIKNFTNTTTYFKAFWKLLIKFLHSHNNINRQQLHNRKIATWFEIDFAISLCF